MFPSTRLGGYGGTHPRMGVIPYIAWSESGEPTDRPDITGLPGLTSDPICTADRRGGILISFGPIRTPTRVINPSKVRDQRSPLAGPYRRRVEAPSTASCSSHHNRAPSYT